MYNAIHLYPLLFYAFSMAITTSHLKQNGGPFFRTAIFIRADFTSQPNMESSSQSGARCGPSQSDGTEPTATGAPFISVRE